MNLTKGLLFNLQELIRIAKQVESVYGFGFELSVLIAGMALEYEKPYHGIWKDNT